MTETPVTLNDNGPAVLTITGLAKSFGTHQVLDDISLQVRKGETVCLLGPSGSG